MQENQYLLTVLGCVLSLFMQTGDRFFSQLDSSLIQDGIIYCSRNIIVNGLCLPIIRCIYSTVCLTIGDTIQLIIKVLSI